MSKIHRPQILPTRLLRSSVDRSLRILDKIPFARRFVIRDYEGPDSSVPLTIVLPLHEKDLWIAKHSVEFARRNVKHPIAEVIAVTPRNPSLQQWAKENNIRWIDEDEALAWSKQEVAEFMPPHAENRGRWLFQQLLKFSADRYIKTDAFLVLDADTLLLKPKVFRLGNELWLDYSHERNLLYLESYFHLLGKKAQSFPSYVCHHMYMEISVLDKLKREIEEHSGESWDKAILMLASAPFWTEAQKRIRPFNYFSEYETYGNFVKNHYEKIHSHYFRNYSFKNFEPDSVDIKKLVRQLPGFYRSASFHSYNSKKFDKKELPHSKEFS